MRPRETYRVARRDLARQAMAQMRAQGEKPNWRLVWATIRAAVGVARATRRTPHPEGAS